MSFESVTIGPCTLYRGDCLDVLPTLEAGSIDMIWTDPPFGHGNTGRFKILPASAVGGLNGAE